jgi:hypothetical protein
VHQRLLRQQQLGPRELVRVLPQRRWTRLTRIFREIAAFNFLIVTPLDIAWAHNSSTMQLR